MSEVNIENIAKKLKEDFGYSYLDRYLEPLSNREEDNLERWLFTQIEIDTDDLSDYDLTEVYQFIQKQEKFLNIANWNWMSQEEIFSLKQIANDSGKASAYNKLSNFKTVNQIAVLCIIFSFVYIFGTTFGAKYIGQEYLRLVDQSLGTVYAIITTVVGFYFGAGFSMQQNMNNTINKSKDQPSDE